MTLPSLRDSQANACFASRQVNGLTHKYESVGRHINLQLSDITLNLPFFKVPDCFTCFEICEVLVQARMSRLYISCVADGQDTVSTGDGRSLSAPYSS